MEVEINMINVEDGDAIILILRDCNESNVIMIDGGKKYFTNRVKRRLDEVLSKENKSGPDLVICTHMDSDHIKGCIEIIKVYGNSIGEIWAFKPNDYLKNHANEFENTVRIKGNNTRNLLNFFGFTFNQLITEAKQLYESYNQLNILFNELNDISYDISNKVKKPVSGLRYRNLDFEVISPSKGFFDSCINDRVGFIDNIKTASQKWRTNKASVVCKLTCDGEIYLFTGDSEISTLNQIPNKEVVLKDLKFLDVPHHGSSNNINQSLIDIMKPQISFISAINDNEHPANCIVNMLETCGEVQITNSSNDTWYLALKDGMFNRIHDNHLFD